MPQVRPKAAVHSDAGSGRTRPRGRASGDGMTGFRRTMRGWREMQESAVGQRTSSRGSGRQEQEPQRERARGLAVTVGVGCVGRDVVLGDRVLRATPGRLTGSVLVGHGSGAAAARSMPASQTAKATTDAPSTAGSQPMSCRPPMAFNALVIEDSTFGTAPPTHGDTRRLRAWPHMRSCRRSRSELRRPGRLWRALWEDARRSSFSCSQSRGSRPTCLRCTT
jgi:hypothetical protein